LFLHNFVCAVQLLIVLGRLLNRVAATQGGISLVILSFLLVTFHQLNRRRLNFLVKAILNLAFTGLEKRRKTTLLIVVALLMGINLEIIFACRIFGDR
jgi:hypothetical protein